MANEITDADRISTHRRTLPTAAFSLRVIDIAWVAAEAERRGVSKSQVVRDLIEQARIEQEAA